VGDDFVCGFTGFVNLSGLPGLLTDRHVLLENRLSRIAHRGPDDETFHDDGTLALGFLTPYSTLILTGRSIPDVLSRDDFQEKIPKYFVGS
jgi:hypothetical protein